MKLTEKEKNKLAKKLTLEQKNHALIFVSYQTQKVHTFGIMSMIFLCFALNNLVHLNIFSACLFLFSAGFFAYQSWKEADEIEKDVENYLLLKGGEKQNGIIEKETTKIRRS